MLLLIALSCVYSCLLLRFCTSPDIPGTEKICVSAISSEFLEFHTAISVADISDHIPKTFLEPMSTFMVKGWSRFNAALACLLHAYSDPDNVLKACVLNALDVGTNVCHLNLFVK